MASLARGTLKLMKQLHGMECLMVFDVFLKSRCMPERTSSFIENKREKGKKRKKTISSRHIYSEQQIYVHFSFYFNPKKNINCPAFT